MQTPRYSGIFQELDLPEDENAGDDLESIVRARNLYITPEVRPIYKLQMKCLIVISTALNRYKGLTTSTYYFKDPEEENLSWSLQLLSHIPRPVGSISKSMLSYSWYVVPSHGSKC